MIINSYIPFLKGSELKNIKKCIDTNFVSTAGELINKFENLFCKLYNFKYSLAVNSGTTALQISIKALGIKKNDIVVVPSYTFAATANAIIYNDSKPWFVDCDEQLDLCINLLEKEFKKKTIQIKNQCYLKSSKERVKGIIPVLTFGKKINFKKYINFAKKYNLEILFDAAACHDPSIFKNIMNKKTFNCCFSFNGNKTMTTGSGGLIASNSKKFIENAKILANVGKNKSKYDYSVVGFNAKMNNIQAALGMGQLKNLGNILKRKRKLFNKYSNFFQKGKIKYIHDKNHVNWVFVLILDTKKIFAKFKKAFHKNNIQFDYFWKPLHLQKPYLNYGKNDLSNTKKFWNKVGILPSHPGLDTQQQKKIFKTLKNLIK